MGVPSRSLVAPDSYLSFFVSLFSSLPFFHSSPSPSSNCGILYPLPHQSFLPALSSPRSPTFQPNLSNTPPLHRSCQNDAIEPYRDWSPSFPLPSWAPIYGSQGSSGGYPPGNTRCPAFENQGQGGPPDTAAAFHESDLGHELVARVESERGG